MITELRQTLTKTEKEAQYDAAAKCLLGEKIILAHILIRTIDEFKGMTAVTRRIIVPTYGNFTAD